MSVPNQIVMTLELPEDICAGTYRPIDGWVTDSEDAHFFGDVDAENNVMIQEYEGVVS